MRNELKFSERKKQKFVPLLFSFPLARSCNEGNEIKIEIKKFADLCNMMGEREKGRGSYTHTFVGREIKKKENLSSLVPVVCFRSLSFASILC
jgi:hypothetical protein